MSSTITNLSVLKEENLALRNQVKLLQSQVSQQQNLLNDRQQVENRENLLTTILNSPDDISIMAIDRKYCYTMFNDKHKAEMLKFWNAEVEIGKNILDYISDSRYRKLIKGEIDKAFEGATLVFSRVHPLLPKHLEYCWRPVLEKGKISGASCFVKDITRQIQDEQQLVNIRESLELSLEAGNSGSWDWDISANTFYWSDQLKRLFSLAEDEVPGLEAWEKIIYPQDREHANRKLIESIEKHIKLESEYRIVKPDGEIRWIRAVGSTIYEGKKPLRMVGLCMDITENLQARANTLQLKRLYATLSQINQAIVRIDNEEDLFTLITKIAVEYGDIDLAWIGILDKDAVRPTAISGYGKLWKNKQFRAYLKKIRESEDPLILETVGTLKLTFDNDISIQIEVDKPREKLISMGLKAQACVPIQKNGDIFGILNLYSRETGFFSAEGVEGLLEEIGLDISFALDNYEKERVKQRWADAFEHSAQGMAIMMAASKSIQTCNPAFARLQGRKIEEVISLNFLDMFSSEFHTKVRKACSLSDEFGKQHLEAILLRKDGKNCPVEVDLVSVKSENDLLLYRVISVQDISARKEAESKLIESEFKFRKLYEDGPFGMVLVNSHLQFISANATFCRQLGYTEEEILSKNIKDITYPYDLKGDIEQIKKLIAKEILVYKTEKRYIRKNGQLMWGSLTATANFDKDGNHLYNIAIIEDITERRLIIDKLQKSEERFRSTLDNMLEGCQIIGFDWRYVYINKAAEVHNRKPSDHLIGRTYQECWPGIAETYVFRMIKNCLEKRKSSRLVNEFVYEDGRIGWFELSIQPVPEGVFILSYDISDRKKAEELLKDTQYHYENILNRLNDVVWTATLDGTQILNLNASFERVFGVSAEALKKDSGIWLASIHPEDRHLAEASNTELLVNGSADVEYRIIHPNGNIRWINDRKTILRNTRGEEFAVGGIAKDITHQKSAEEKLIASEARLKLFVDYAPASIAMFDKEMRYLAVSRQFLKDYQIKEEDLIERSHYEIFPEIPQRWREMHSRCLEGLSAKALDDLFIRSDGTTDYIQWEIHPWYDINNKVGGIILFSQVVTEQKKAELTIRETNLKLAQAQRIAHLGSWEHNFIAGELTWSEEMYHILGFEPGTPISIEKAALVFPAEDKVKFEEALVNCFNNRTPYSMDYRIIRPDGEERYIHDEGEVTFDENGRPVYMVGTTQDISERMRSDKALRESEEKQRSILRAAMDGFWQTNTSGEFMEVNDAYCRMSGYSREELLGLKIKDIEAVEDPKEVFEHMSKIIETGSDRFESRHRRKDGSTYPVEISVQYKELDKMLVMFIRDISEQKRKEEEIKLSRESFVKVFYNTPTGLMISKSKDGVILMINEEYQRIFGYTQRELIGKSMLELNIFTGKNDWHKMMASLERKGTVSNIELKVRTRGGKLRTIMCYSDSIQFDNEDCLLGAFVDITEKKEAEEEIKRLNNDLENKVIERTEQLLAANKELESFSYSVSHDLRAPLRAIDGFSNMLMHNYGEALGEDGRRMGEIIRGSTRQMAQLIDDLLAFSRLSRSDMKSIRIDMKLLAQTVFDQITTEEERKKIQFEVQDLCNANGDPALIKQVWSNLLSNAIKYSSKVESPTIQVRCRHEQGSCIYSVQDNGAGFNMNYYNKLFGVFQRLHSAKEFEGTGVGLATVKRIINRHGGEVWAEGREGEGATFHFSMKPADTTCALKSKSK